MGNGKVLDCESIESTYNSLEDILGVRKELIEGIFNSLDIDDLCRKNPYISPDDLILSAIRKYVHKNITVNSTCWFHITRTHITNRFQEGILPLGAQLNLIWDYLFTLLDGYLSRKEWDDFRTNIGSNNANHFAYMYLIKINNPLHYGPYAFLIRDMAFANVGNRDYFKGAEIIEDISNYFTEIYDFDLISKFTSDTKPCVVKFIKDGGSDGYLSIIVHYLYRIYRQLELAQTCNTCFDGKGVAVPKCKILKIEFPEIQNLREK